MKNPILLQKPTSDHCGPGYVGKSKYLKTKNLLSEFDTEEKRLTVLRNLGILNNQIDVVLELGDDTHAVMSQKAVTEAINNNNKNIEIYESENNLPTSAATGRIAAVVYQTNNETVNRLYFKNEEAWKSINDVKIVDAENKLDRNAPQGSLASVAVNTHETFTIKDSYVKGNSNVKVIKKLPDNVNLDFLTLDTWFDLALGAPDCKNSEGSIPSDKGIEIWSEYYTEDEDTGKVYRGVWVYTSEFGEETLYTPDGANIEMLNKLNELINSLSGVVVYGTYDDDFENNFYFVDTSDEELELAGRVFGDFESRERKTDLHIKDVEGWRKINDIKIVDSVDKLDPNAPQGTLATVAINTIGEVSFSELYQPTEEDFSSDTLPIAKLSKVSGISVIVPDPSIAPPEFEIALYSEDFNPENGVGSVVILMTGIATLISMTNDSPMEFELLIYNEDENTLTLNEENLAELNNILSEKVYVYGGTCGRNEDGYLELIDPSVSDFIYRVISGIQKTDLYIKDVKGWKVFGDELGKKFDLLNSRVDTLQSTVENFETIIVNSADELPEDVPTGTLASVLYKVEKTELLPVSKAYVAGGKVSGLTIVYPETADIGDFNIDSTVNSLGLNFSNTNVNRGVIGVANYSGKNAIIGTDGNSVPSVLVEYDSDGNLKSVNQSFIDTLMRNVTTYRTISGRNVLDKYIFANGISTTYNSDLYVKTDEGWRQIKELVDNSVTTEKISNGSVTIDKLSPELQTSMSKVSTFLDASAQSDEIIDTLKEIQEYIESDESGAAAMVESIASNKSDIEQLKQKTQYLTEEEYNSLKSEGKINEDVIYIVTYN